ncbi:MAG: 30S ribosomal protein S2 [bacterium]|nr:30S ribosomal protein S2 [bacterium]
MEIIEKDALLEELFSAGAHYGFAKSKRHPSIVPHVYGQKNTIDIINLEDTIEQVMAAENFLRQRAATGKKVLFVGNKKEAQDPVRAAAATTGMLFVANRWIGGTFTNFKEIRRRVDYLEKLITDRDSGDLSKYTKREQGMIKLQIEKLLGNFEGIRAMKELPAAVVVIDPRYENTCLREAKQVGVPVISLAGSDCDINTLDYPIVANDSAPASIKWFLNRLATAVSEGKNVIPEVKEGEKAEKTLAKKEEAEVAE